MKLYTMHKYFCVSVCVVLLLEKGTCILSAFNLQNLCTHPSNVILYPLLICFEMTVKLSLEIINRMEIATATAIKRKKNNLNFTDSNCFSNCVLLQLLLLRAIFDEF